MKRLTLLPGLLFLMLQAAFSQESGSCKPVNLVCDYLVNPLGIDNPAPRLSWMLNDARKGARQTACQVIVDKDSLELIAGKGTIWDSGKKDSEQILITYSGQELRPFTKYYWRVNVWDKDGVKSSSDINSFETGMMGMEYWQGAWISDNKDINYRPAPYFRKVFDARKKIWSARAYIAVAGLYELYINGEKIGNHRLDPLYTRFDRRNFYVTYDITSQIQKGKMRLVCCWAMDGIIISQWPCGTFIVHLGVTVLLSVWMCGLLMRMVLLKSFLRSGTGKLHPAH